MNETRRILLPLALAGLVVLAACGGSRAEATPTVDPAAIETAAVSTFAAGLTETALALPTDTSSPTWTSTSPPTITPTAHSQATVARGASSADPCYDLTLVRDISIPDNTLMSPDQSFVKIWRVRNTGTCGWTAGFKFAFTGGNRMGGGLLVLDEDVPPGGEFDLIVPMTSPGQLGTAQGYWRMSGTDGVFFGDEVFVLIRVGTPTPTPVSFVLRPESSECRDHETGS